MLELGHIKRLVALCQSDVELGTIRVHPRKRGVLLCHLCFTHEGIVVHYGKVVKELHAQIRPRLNVVLDRDNPVDLDVNSEPVRRELC